MNLVNMYMGYPRMTIMRDVIRVFCNMTGIPVLCRSSEVTVEPIKMMKTKTAINITTSRTNIFILFLPIIYS